MPASKLPVLGITALFLLLPLTGCGEGQFSGQVEIRKPAETVFEWITQADKRRQWDTSIVKETRLNDIPAGVGARYEEVMNMQGHTMDLVADTLEFDPGKRLHMALNGGGMALDVVYTLAESSGVTTVNFAGKFDVTNLFMKPMAGMIQDASLKKLNADLSRLKSVVEAQN